MHDNPRRARGPKWLHEPLISVVIFLILLGLGASLGILFGKEAWGLMAGLPIGVVAAIAHSKLYCDNEAGELFEGTSCKSPQASNKDTLDKLAAYIDGKMKRYTLLFGVNGGAFAIVQLMTDQTRQFPGKLTLASLSTGAVIFSSVMIIDIWLWGYLMRRKQFVGQEMAFTVPGRVILLLIGGLIISGWILAGLPSELDRLTRRCSGPPPTAAEFDR